MSRCTSVHTRTIPIVVAVSWGARVLASWLGQSRKPQFYGCGTKSQGGTYWVRMYAATELRFFVLTVHVKRKVVRLTTTGPFTVCGSFSFAQTEVLSSSLWRSLLWENTYDGLFKHLIYCSHRYILFKLLKVLGYGFEGSAGGNIGGKHR